MNRRLEDVCSAHAGTGRVEWIGLRPAHRAPVVTTDQVWAEAGQGLMGDRSCRRRVSHSARQVTLLQAEHLSVIAALSRRPSIDPAWLRRNLVISGINLLALQQRRFRVGEVLLEGAGPCHPCSRMEEVLGPGGYNALRGHGGITARVYACGWIYLGSPVILVPDKLNDAEAT